MSEPVAYLNGRFVPAAEAAVSVVDSGFVQGVTVAEQVRTLGGQLFRLDAHIDRLFHSLSIVGVDAGRAPQELAQVAVELAARNHRLLSEGDDLGLCIFVTPGLHGPMIDASQTAATIGIHTFPLRFDLWADKYRTGQALATTDVAQVSARCWPPELKCRSRMHYYLADRRVRLRYPDSRALMVDEDGYITESTTANVVLYCKKSGLMMPPAGKILPGISLAVLLELAEQLEVPCHEQDLTPQDVAAADEVFLTSTSVCMLPVVQFNGQSISTGMPGPMFRRFLAAWDRLVGVYIAEQAMKFSSR